MALAYGQAVTVGGITFYLAKTLGSPTNIFSPGDDVRLCFYGPARSIVLKVDLVTPQGATFTVRRETVTVNGREQCLVVKQGLTSQDVGRWEVLIQVFDPTNPQQLIGGDRISFAVGGGVGPTPPPPPPPSSIPEWAIAAAVVAVVAIAAVAALMLRGRGRGREIVIQPSPVPPVAPSPAEAKGGTAVLQPKTAVGIPLAFFVLPNGVEIPILSQSMEFGRENFRGYVSDDKLAYISARHFRIFLAPDGWYIEDLGSTNGTVVDGVEIRGRGPVKLKAGSKVRPANMVELTFRPQVGG